jgi:hypothetical protein
VGWGTDEEEEVVVVLIEEPSSFVKGGLLPFLYNELKYKLMYN